CLASTARRFGPMQASLASLALALALSSHHEAIVLLVPWIFAMHLSARPVAEPAQRGVVRMRDLEPGRLVPLLAAPALLVLLWPHLQAETGRRLADVFYGPYKAHHDPIAVAGAIHDQATGSVPHTLE